ncbi:hypothetical protein Daus18300_009604 [Diaporthe australafricana]|uniref:Uncharacterized protein n=1 Tax=Diaporthe australafricana TaxID=127596 RepID=A0ABR3WDJ7_9PEZI
MDKLTSSLQGLNTGDDNRKVTETGPATDLAPALGSDEARSTAPQSSLEKLPVEIQRLILSNAPSVQMLSALVHASPQLHGVYAEDRLPILRQVLAQSLEGVFVDAYGAYLSGTDLLQGQRAETLPWEFIEEHEARCIAPAVPAPQLSLDEIIQMSDFHTSVVEPLTEAYTSWALSSLPLPEEKARESHGHLSNTERRRIQRAMYRLQLFCNVCGSAGDSSWERIEGNVDRLRVLSMFSAWEVEEILSVHEFAKDKYSEVFKKVAWDLNEEKNPKYGNIDMTSINEFMLLISDDGTINAASLNIVLRHGLRLLSDSIKTEDHGQLADTIRAVIVSGSDGNMPVGIYGEDWIDDAVWDYNQEARREQWPSHRDSAQDSSQKMIFDGDALDSPPLAWTLFWKEEYSNLFGSHIPKGLRRWGFVMWDATRLDSTAKEAISLEWDYMYDMTDPREDDYT